MPAEKRRKGCLGAVILLIAVGLTGRVSAWNNGRLKDGREISAAQRYFDAVSPEDRETFIKYYLDKGLEERIPDHVSITPADFSFIIYQLQHRKQHNKPPLWKMESQSKYTTSSTTRQTPTPSTPTPSTITPPTLAPTPTPQPENGPNLPSLVELALDVNDHDIYNCVKYSLVCYSSGCIDPNDIANICCPF